MCMLSYFPPGVRADVTALTAGAKLNTDGHGFAIWRGFDDIIVRKGMAASLLIAEFDLLRTEYPHGPAVFHSRWITSGDPSPDNAQPFTVVFDGGAKGVIAHNGTIPMMGVSPAEEGWSDTRLLAFRSLGTFPGLHWDGRDSGEGTGAKWRSAVDQYMKNTSSRVIIITPSGEGLLLGAWDTAFTHNGVRYSSMDFVPAPELEVEGPTTSARARRKKAFRWLAEHYIAGNEEAGQMMAALLEADPAMGTGALNRDFVLPWQGDNILKVLGHLLPAVSDRNSIYGRILDIRDRAYARGHDSYHGGDDSVVIDSVVGRLLVKYLPESDEWSVLPANERATSDVDSLTG